MKPFAFVLSLTAVIFVAVTAFEHERREIAGMQVVFGGEPEPFLDGELCFLRWRFTDLPSGEPVTDLEEVLNVMSVQTNIAGGCLASLVLQFIVLLFVPYGLYNRSHSCRCWLRNLMCRADGDYIM